MKRLIVNILIICMALTITGCGCKKEETKADVNVTKGDIVLVCSSDDSIDGVNIKTTNTYNFGKDQFIINMKIDTTYSFSSEDQFKENVDELKKNVSEMKSIEETLYNYKIDENSKTIFTSFAYVKMDIPEEARPGYTVKAVLNRAENGNLNCELSGIEREELQ